MSGRTEKVSPAAAGGDKHRIVGIATTEPDVSYRQGGEVDPCGRGSWWLVDLKVGIFIF